MEEGDAPAESTNCCVEVERCLYLLWMLARAKSKAEVGAPLNVIGVLRRDERADRRRVSSIPYPPVPDTVQLRVESFRVVT